MGKSKMYVYKERFCCGLLEQGGWSSDTCYLDMSGFNICQASFCHE
jgi:hypothetical protein